MAKLCGGRHSAGRRWHRDTDSNRERRFIPAIPEILAATICSLRWEFSFQLARGAPGADARPIINPGRARGMNMPTQFAIAGVNAKRRGAETGMVSAENGSIQPDLLAFSISLFPRKTWAFLTDLLGLSDSAARKRVAGDTEFSADDMAKMLRTERGFEVLAAVMAGSGVRWWKICAPLMEVADIQSAQIAARRRLTRVMKGAVDADTNLAAAIARADALAFSDEDFMRPHGDALRSMARVPDRALAAAKGRRR